MNKPGFCLFTLLLSSVCIFGQLLDRCEFNNIRYNVGDHIPGNACEPCECGPNGNVICAIIQCSPAPCVDSTTAVGECCGLCPNGQNCRFEGETIPSGLEVRARNGSFCSCPDPSADNPVDAICRVRCEVEGQMLDPGEAVTMQCQTCACQQDGHVLCGPMDCPTITCVDPVVDRGQCCPTCPLGPSCFLGQTVIPGGVDVHFQNSNWCKCPNSTDPNPQQAICGPRCDLGGRLYNPGDEITRPTDSCQVCRCSEFGTLLCNARTCPKAECVDSVHANGDCCETCPNGPNCYHGDRIVSASIEEYVGNNTWCKCNGDRYSHCSVRCRGDGNTFYSPGENVPDPCRTCTCVDNGTVSCTEVDCPATPCVNPDTPPGQCCPMCPNGPNCESEGQLITVGDIRNMAGTRWCYCENPLVVECGPRCEVNGTLYPIGTRVSGSVCGPCVCMDSGEVKCSTQECFPPLCVDAETPPGECCPTCPRGRNCLVGDRVIPAESQVQVNRTMVCRCPDVTSPDPLTAFCGVRCEYNGGVLKPGQTISPDPCRDCICKEDGTVSCTSTSCRSPPCVNAITPPNECCPICPNGPNCRAAARVIPAGREVQVDRYQLCTCPDHAQGGSLEATCQRRCEQEGVMYNPGDSMPATKCQSCTCRSDGTRRCGPMRCPRPACGNPYTPSGECCPLCPEGPVCQAGTRVIPANTDIRVGQSTWCRCPEQLTDPLQQAVCGSRCTHNGVMHMPGDRLQRDSCTSCVCRDDSTFMCEETQCFPPPCYNPFTPSGQCCAICPDGPNCRYQGRVYPIRKDTPIGNNTFCRCSGPNSADCRIMCDLRGKLHTPGEKLPGRPCEDCTCSPEGAVICRHQPCPRLRCANPVTPPSSCCPVCPEIPVATGCRHGNRLIQSGEEVRVDGNNWCSCPNNTWGQNAKPICSTRCEKDGVLYRPGDLMTGNVCTPCMCTKTGRRICLRIRCEQPKCASPTTRPQQCCPVCPGSECRRRPVGNDLQRFREAEKWGRWIERTCATGTVYKPDDCGCRMTEEIIRDILSKRAA